MKPAILLTVTRGIGHLAGALLDRADLELIILHETIIPYVERLGIPFRCFNDLLTPEVRLQIGREAVGRAEAIVKELFSSQMRDQWPQFDYKTWAALRAGITRMLREDISLEMILINVLRRWACEADLRLVIVQEDICRDTKTLCFAARQLGIPTLHTLHGFPYGAVNSTTMSDPYNTDVVAVFSERAKAVYESLGVPSERIVVTGNFEWDIYTRPPKPDHRAAACRELGLDPGRPVVVYALTYTHWYSRISASYPLYTHLIADAVIDAFVELSRRHPDWQLVLRPHPNDPDIPKNLRVRAERAGLDQLRIDNGMAQIFCLAMTDVMVCTQSNFGIEAILAGKPVVNCVIDEFGKEVFREGMGPLFSEDDAVLFVRKVEDIAPAIEATLLDPEVRQGFRRKRPETIRRFNYLNDGKATERLCTLIFDMIQDGGRYLTPVARYPEFERALVRAAPVEAERVLVTGRAARYVADALRFSQPEIHVEVQTRPAAPAGNTKYCAVVLADPIPHCGEGEDLLRRTRALLREGGTLVAPFRHGADVEAREAFRAGAWAPPGDAAEPASPLGAYSRRGVEVMISRCGLEPVAVEALPASPFDPGPHCPETADGPAEGQDPFQTIHGWVVRARVREAQPGPLARAQAEHKRHADEKNRRGEALSRAGEYERAAVEFAAAAECVGDALYLNNLGTALDALDRPDEAWKRFCEALHYDPYFQPARDNLRAVARALDRTAEAENLLRLFGADREE